MNGPKKGPLRYGDVISLCITDGPEYSGFLSTLGNIDSRVVVRPQIEAESRAGHIPKKFRDCLFQVCPMNRYLAQRQYAKHRQQAAQNGAGVKHGGEQSALHKQLRVAADMEKQQNRLEAEKILGTPVKYGSVLQLLHLKSNKYLTTNKRLTGLMERKAMRVTLEIQGNEGSWFYVRPYYKHRMTHDNVIVDDKVRLKSVNAGQMLHASELALQDHPSCMEVNVADCIDGWKLNMFHEYQQEDDSKTIKAGDVVRLFHAEEAKYLTGDKHPNKDQKNEEVRALSWTPWL